MMTITRGLAAGVLLAGAAVGLAAPASADLVDGSYQLTYSEPDGPPPTTWIVTSCGAGCKTLQSPPYDPTDWHLQGSTWTAPSEDGSTHTIDNNTLAGSVNGHPFQLVKVG